MRLATTRLARRLRQRADSGLSPTLGAALATIERHGPLTPSELAERERVQRPTATRIVGQLAERGLVEREDHPEDRRSHRVAVTPAGRALAADARLRKTAYLAEALEHLDAEDQRTLERAAAILERVLEHDGCAPAGAAAPSGGAPQDGREATPTPAAATGPPVGAGQAGREATPAEAGR